MKPIQGPPTFLLYMKLEMQASLTGIFRNREKFSPKGKEAALSPPP